MKSNKKRTELTLVLMSILSIANMAHSADYINVDNNLLHHEQNMCEVNKKAQKKENFFKNLFKGKLASKNKSHQKYQELPTESLSDQAKAILNHCDKTKKYSDNDYIDLVEIMQDKAKTAKEKSSNAIATLAAGKFFLKTSKGKSEHESLRKIREQYQLENKPQFKDEIIVVPSSYYDAANDLTLTISPMAGELSFRDYLHGILKDKTKSDLVKDAGTRAGRLLADFHNITDGARHGDPHLNNVRLSHLSDNKMTDQTKFYIIDIETLAKNFEDNAAVAPKNCLRDLMDLIAKTTCHRFKSDLYGAGKGFIQSIAGIHASRNEKDFVNNLIDSYLDTADMSIVKSLQKQFNDFQKTYHSDVDKFMNSGPISAYNKSFFKSVFKTKIFAQKLEKRIKGLRA